MRNVHQNVNNKVAGNVASYATCEPIANAADEGRNGKTEEERRVMPWVGGKNLDGRLEGKNKL